GENLGVALRFLSAGARRVVCLEKFVPFQNNAYTRDLYLALREQLPQEQRARFDAAVDLSKDVKLNETRLQYLRRGVEEAEVLTQKSSFDFVVSNAVLEEVYDTDAAFAAMDSVLKPGGYSLHKIDLRDYGMFTNQGFHPLEFLTIPDGIYRYMSESVGQPNRRLADYYRNTMARLGYRTTVFTTVVLGRPDLPLHKVTLQKGVDYTDTELDLIRRIRPRLLERYRSLPDEDLLVAGIFLMARKPGP
ncbi:MAG: methyltransferase domain-containing protein, partial [Bryobacteraceae bacterium]